MADIEIEIDGNLINAKAGEMLITVTDREGISVPRFCYHKKLSVAANCRMCLVDVEGAPKPQPACSTPVADGMKIHTQNEKAKESQKAVMEFLLINHPLDCPICDQGGECELQDVAMEYGSDVSRFTEGKRIVADSNIGPLIHTDMTRCIHCTRCVRFGSEIAGVMEMGGTGRGDHTKIEPFLEEGITSELSGNMIDVCPVGALTSKPFRYELRTWQMNAVQSIARHDLVGSNVYAQTYKGKLKRIVARDNDAVNETWISDRDRFSYEGLESDNRLLKPQIKVEGQWKVVTWDVALDFAIKGITSNIINSHQADKFGVLASNTATLEEYFLLQKLTREIGSENIDYRLNVKDLDQSMVLKSDTKLIDLESVDYALVIGSNPRLEQPMINHRLRKAQLKGASIDRVGFMAFDSNFKISNDHIVAPNALAATLAGVLASILDAQGVELPDYLSSAKQDDDTKALAERLLSSDQSAILLGEHVINNKNATSVANLVTEIAKNSKSSTMNLTETGNSMAAKLAGFVPGKGGMDVNRMLDSELKAVVLLDVYPDYDHHHAQTMVDQLNSDNTFVVSMNSFKDDKVNEYSDVLLPIACFYETSGSHVNVENKVQSFAAAVSAPSESKPAWKVIKVLADLLKLPGFHYNDSTQVLSEVSHQSHKTHEHDKRIDSTTKRGIETIWQASPYTIDALLRHSPSLQKTKAGQVNNAFMNAATAKKLELKQGDDYLGVAVEVNDTVANNCVFVQANHTTIGENS